MKYVTYQLLYIGNEGHQPYGTLAASGATFEGGVLSLGGRLVGYVDGTPEQVEAAIALGGPFSMREVDADEVLAIAERAKPTNTADRDGAGYLSPPAIDAKSGRMVPRTWEASQQAAPAVKEQRSQEAVAADLATLDTDSKAELLNKMLAAYLKDNPAVAADKVTLKE